MDDSRAAIVAVVVVLALIALVIWARGRPDHRRGELPPAPAASFIV